MDPVSVIGLATTAVGVVDRLAKTLNFLLTLSTKFKYVNSQIALLVGYLSSLNAGISEIAGIVKSLSGKIEYQNLAQSLDTTLQCTKFSLSFLESKLESFHLNSDDQQTLLKKVNFIFRNAEFEEYTNGISRHVNALNLHLSALQSRSILEQRGILESTEAESIMIAMEDETSSLLCLGDSQSVVSKRSEDSNTSAALDITFDFDAEILGSKIYAVAYRSHLRQTIASGKRLDVPESQRVLEGNDYEDDSSSIVTVTPAPDKRKDLGRTHIASSQSQSMATDWTFLLADKATADSMPQTVDSTIAQDASQANEPEESNKSNTKVEPPAAVRKTAKMTRSRARSLLNLLPLRNTSYGVEKFQKEAPELKVLVLGPSESGKTTLLKGMKAYYEGNYTLEERLSFKENVFTGLIEGMRIVIQAMESLEIALDSGRLEYDVQVIMNQSTMFAGDCLPAEVSMAVAALSRDEGFQLCLSRRREYQLSHCIDHYIKSIDRIGAPDYVPSESDILLSRVRTTGITMSTFSSTTRPDGEPIVLKIYDVGGMRGERRKWIHCFEDTAVILFTVDIGSYDEILWEDNTVNRMQEALGLWDMICNSRWFMKTELMLIFTKHAKLVTKLKDSPLKDYFPGYNHLPDYRVDMLQTNADRATKYLIDRFTSLNQNKSKKIHVLVMPGLPTNKDWESIERCYGYALKARRAYEQEQEYEDKTPGTR